MAFRCYCVDDLPLNFENLVRFINQTNDLVLVGTESDPLKAMDGLVNGTIEADITFLDIDMPEISGLELAAMVNKVTKVIFTTAYTKYAVQSYGTEAIDYLVKPINYPRFLQAVQKAKQSILLQEVTRDRSNDVIFVPGDGKGNFVTVTTKDIIYISSESSYINIFMTDRKIMSYCTMETILQSLSASNFIRVHRSYAVNLNHVKKGSATSLYMSNKQFVPLGRSYKKDILKFVVRK